MFLGYTIGREPRETEYPISHVLTSTCLEVVMERWLLSIQLDREKQLFYVSVMWIACRL